MKFKMLMSTVLCVSLLTTGSFAYAGSSGVIKSIFKEKSITCRQKYEQLIYESYARASKRMYLDYWIGYGLFGASMYGAVVLQSLSVVAGAGGVTAILIGTNILRYKANVRHIKETRELLNQTESVLNGKVSANQDIPILVKMYNSKAKYFNQYQVSSYEGIAWTIEEAVDTEKACGEGRPWSVKEFRNYAMLRVKQKYEDVVENAKKTNLLPE